MSKFADNTEKRTAISNREYSRKEKMAGYFYDLSKLSFGGVVIGAGASWLGSKDDSIYLYVLILGLYITIGLAYTANRILRPNK